ncbi:amine sulfotransferase-like [Chiloscyllium plagiosum]|uniref:amine sulfotransferase-like n=1 Tax=Chiloscyllium plagiosum TaxID=36176 RepID=UPI001CB7B711|nr:amine sulfotransferase-like [Chiloscyllium plagiosum]XP_043573554.1 amine sulfotransferase-like [Chiloscyllium plagiosum]XP_043573555.1 amine sulfotransferase-like [Chiloscyllium plagiosum]XP_043573556.1 amine sulfotransferase-like [Chiloscyllium plagiosum]
MENSEEPMTYFRHNGIIFCSPFHSAERLERLKDFNIDPHIPVLITYPKSGTTWMQQIMSLILCNDNDSKKMINLYTRAPWMESVRFNLEIRDCQILTTHLNYQMVPNCVKSKMFKIIYVTRNPKDVIVSSYHFHKYSRFLEAPKNFQDFLENFVEGNVFFGSWFEHIRDWHSHKDELNILFVAYEDMKNDLRSVVQKVASFLNKKLDEETLESILNQCTFKHMKENPKTNYKDVSDLFNSESGSFYRKGITGDWKNYFLVSQNEWFDSIYQEKMGDFPLKFDNM